MGETGPKTGLDQHGYYFADVRHSNFAVESQGSLRQFALSQFHKLVPEGFSWSSPSQALSWRGIQAVANRLHISI